MSTTIQADYTLVSWLEAAESALTSDLFLVSQLDGNEYISKKLPYQKLSALMFADVRNLASAAASSYIGNLCAQVYINKSNISAISDLLDDTVSAVIKMANCIQTNKANISAISSFLMHNVVGENGISVKLPTNLSAGKLYIGHSGKITADSTIKFKKFKYDAFGHITGTNNVTSADVLALGNIISGGGIGLSVNSTNKKILDLKAATATALGGVKIDNSKASINNLSILPNGTLSACTVDPSIGSNGLSGQLNYLTPNSGYVKQTVFRNDIYICENQNDENKSIYEPFSFKDVFDNWNQGGLYEKSDGSRKWFGITDYPLLNGTTSVSISGHIYHCPINIRTLDEMLAFNASRGTQPNSYAQITTQQPNSSWKLYHYFYINPTQNDITSLVQTSTCSVLTWHNGGVGAKYWVYNSAVSSIIQPMNTDDWTFYYSPQKYGTYQLCVDLESYDTGDDNYNGIIGAFGIDSNGQPEMITFIRQLQPDGYSWFARYTNTLTSYYIDKKFENPNPSTTWGNAGKTRVYIERNGDIITAKTSDFSTAGNLPLRDDSLITVNLNGLHPGDGQSLRGAASVGFINLSQLMSIFKVHKFAVPKTILRIDRNEWIEVSTTGHRETQTGRFNDRVGIGRFVKNNATNKTFYVDVNSYPKVSEISGSLYNLPVASSTKLGGIKLNDNIRNVARRTYPLRLSGDYAYVSVDWQPGNADTAVSWIEAFEGSLLCNTLTAGQTQVISSISQRGGNVTGIGKSTWLYDKLRELSGKVDTAPAVQLGNLDLDYNNNTNVLDIKTRSGTNIDQVQLNPYIVSSVWTPIQTDDRGRILDYGSYLKLIYNDYATGRSPSSIYAKLSIDNTLMSQITTNVINNIDASTIIDDSVLNEITNNVISNIDPTTLIDNTFITSLTSNSAFNEYIKNILSSITQPSINPDVTITINLDDSAAIDLDSSATTYTVTPFNYRGRDWNVKSAMGKYLWKSDTTINRPFVATASIQYGSPDNPTYGVGLICDGLQTGVFHPAYSKIRTLTMTDGFYSDIRYLGYFSGQGRLFGAASANKSFYKETTTYVARDTVIFYIKYV